MTNNPSSPASSEQVERPVLNREVSGSNPERGSYQYIVVRKELAGGALLAQVAHAAGESADKCGGLAPETRVVVLAATKEQLAELWELLEAQLITSAYSRILETDGPLAGSITAIGVVTVMREELREAVPLLRALKVWR